MVSHIISAVIKNLFNVYAVIYLALNDKLASFQNERVYREFDRLNNARTRDNLTRMISARNH